MFSFWRLLFLAISLSLLIIQSSSQLNGYVQINSFTDAACTQKNYELCLDQTICYGSYNQPAAPNQWDFYKLTGDDATNTLKVGLYSDSDCATELPITAAANIYTYDTTGATTKCYKDPFFVGEYYFTISQCPPPGTDNGIATPNVVQVEYTSANCGAPIVSANKYQANVCVNRVVQYGPTGEKTGEGSTIIGWEAADDTVTEHHYDTTDCSGTPTSAPYTLGTCDGTEKWEREAYIIPGDDTSGAAVGINVYANLGPVTSSTGVIVPPVGGSSSAAGTAGSSGVIVVPPIPSTGGSNPTPNPPANNNANVLASSFSIFSLIGFSIFAMFISRKF